MLCIYFFDVESNNEILGILNNYLCICDYFEKKNFSYVVV